MTHAALAPLIGPEFDKFLCASIGEGRNGTTLSVISALARLGVDPWQEAANLGRMPKEAATQRLAALIAALPDEPTADIPARTVAADLITLLPRSNSFNVRSADSAFAAVGPQQTRVRIALAALAIVIAIIFALSTNHPPEPRNTAESMAPSVGDAVTALPRKLVRWGLEEVMTPRPPRRPGRAPRSRMPGPIVECLAEPP
jgi:hypothetical protein